MAISDPSLFVFVLTPGERVRENLSNLSWAVYGEAMPALRSIASITK